MVDLNPLTRHRKPTPEGGIGKTSTFQDWNKENPPKPNGSTAHEGAGDGSVASPAEEKAPRTFARVINPADWEGVPVPDREWIVPDYIPDNTVTLLYGDGSVGKSLLTLQLAAARSLARDWIGLLPEPGRTLVLSAEDDEDELHRRLDDIRRFYNVPWAEFAHIRLVDLVGEDSILGTLMKGQIEPAPMYHTLDAYMTTFKPGLTALDVLADLFAGQENDRTQARQFIGLLKRLCRKHGSAILLLAHPSLTGMNSGTGQSGSTGWNNSVRSRLYFQTAKASDGTSPNENLRTLEGKKANYGVRGGKIDLEWKNGLFVPVHGPAGLDKLAAEQKAEEVFLGLLEQFTSEGRNVVIATGKSYAPAAFADHDDGKGISKGAFKKAMDRLLKAHKIKSVEYGSPSTRRNKLVIQDRNKDETND